MLLFEFTETVDKDGNIMPVDLGYTHKVFKKFDSKLGKCGFVSAMAHVGVDLNPEVCESMPNEMILDAIENDRLTHPPLQKDTVYFFCQMVSVNEESKLFKLLEKPNENYKSITLKLDSISSYERDYFKEEFTKPIIKDLKIINDSTNGEIGWYNLNSNILWMSDIGHNKDSAIKHISYILDRIYEYKLTGELEVLPDLTIGADPEFEILTTKVSSPEECNGKAIAASSLFQTDMSSEVGHNGNPETGELRPKYANHPLRLVRNLKRSVKKLVRNPAIGDFAIYAGGGWTKQLGGHIHFNIRTMPDKLKYALFDLIGKHVRDGMDRSRRKTSQSYMGRDGSEVIRSTESHPGIEWRFLPSFIVNEDISKAILCTTWAVIKGYYANEIPETTDPMEAGKIISILQGLSLYEIYKSHIDKFIDLFIVHKTSMEGIDLKDGWNMKTPLTNSNVRISSNIDWVMKNFTPINVDIPNNISISIELSGQDNELYTIGKLGEETLEMIAEFAEAHFCVHRHADGNPERGHKCNIYLPYAWRVMKKPDMAFDVMKNLIQKVILNLVEREVT